MNRTRIVLVIVSAILLVAVLGSASLADVTNGSSKAIGGVDQTKGFKLDSLFNLDGTPKSPTSRAEHDLQWYLDSLGYDIDVENDELGHAVFCGVPGINTATMVIEVAGSAVYATSGYYAAGDTSIFYQMFGPTDGPGDSVQFTFSVLDSVGFYMKPNLPGDNNTWLTETSLNWDGFDHAVVFSTGTPHEVLICFEDLPNGGDEDYQDLVFRVKFSNNPPEVVLPDDSTVLECDPSPICFDIDVIDPNCEGDSVWLEMVSGEGSFSPVAGNAEIHTSHCFTPSGGGIYTFVFAAVDIDGAVDTATITFDVQPGASPVVTVPDSSLNLCDPVEICLPVEIIDPDCDVVSVTTNLGDYSGTQDNYDQVARINVLGGTISQLGGGAPGTILETADDFVPPINSQSGVSVTLPNFAFVSQIINSGSFPTGSEPGNSADHLIGPPTDMTFTTPGAGGPDGGSGDGSVAFSSNNHCVIGFPQEVTTCNGANVDFIVFTNTAGGGSAQLKFKLNGTTVHTINRTLPGGSVSTGMGGVTFDLPDGITFNQVRIECTSGHLELDAFAARTSPSPTAEDICFWVDTSGVYEVIVTATDNCGNVDTDTGLVTVTLNSAPVADAGTDQSVFVCDFAQICLPVSFSDPDNNLAVTELVSGPGTLNAGLICFTPSVVGAYTFVIHAVDDCGLEDYDTVVVTITGNDPPVADAPPTGNNFFQCQPEELCHTFTATDPNGGILTWAHYVGVGSITPGGEFCFTPTTSGTYGASVIVSDSCGLADTVSIVYNLTVNTPPVATDPATPVQLTQCTAEEICHQFSATDAENGTLAWSQTGGDGTLTADGLWCFTPITSGTYSVQAVVTDSCGLADTTTLSYELIVNTPPTIALAPDTSIQLCAPEELCVSYTVSDPQGMAGLVEALVAGSGTIDTAANQICFTPTSAGDYEIIVTVTDSCGASDRDTLVFNVTYGDFAQIDCPTEAIEVSLCDPGQVCQQINITPAGATVTVLGAATYAAGELCFFAASSGNYTFTLIAEADCGADTCEVTFNVEIGEAAQIDCPAPSNVFLCAADDVCIPVGVMGAGAVTTVSPIGSYAAGNLCFPADTAGHYEIEMIASTVCGTDTCVVVADVAINSNPVAVDPPTPVDTFLCATDQVCFQFQASDADGGSLTWTRLTGDGSVTDAGLWCFDASANGTYSVTAKVVDSCGAADTTTLAYNVEINSAPQFSFGNDTTAFRCGIGQICVPYTLSDANDNVDVFEIVEGPGTIYQGTSTICFSISQGGEYQIVAAATDECAAQSVDTIVVTVVTNNPPVADAGPDQTVFQCAPAEICWPASGSDPDDNLQSVVLESGPGTYSGGEICFTPTGTLDYEFVLKATDDCGETDYDTVSTAIFPPAP